MSAAQLTMLYSTLTVPQNSRDLMPARGACQDPRQPRMMLVMTRDILFGISAIVALLPACAMGVRRNVVRDALFWASLAGALAGPIAWSVIRMDGVWRADLSTTLWVTVSASMVVFAVV